MYVTNLQVLLAIMRENFLIVFSDEIFSLSATRASKAQRRTNKVCQRHIHTSSNDSSSSMTYQSSGGVFHFTTHFLKIFNDQGPVLKTVFFMFLHDIGSQLHSKVAHNVRTW